jgi:hypothetical protein
LRYPAASIASLPAKSAVFGWWPIATKTASRARSRFESSRTSRSRTPVTYSSPSTSSTIECQATSIFSFASSRSCMIFEARRSPRRWTRVTLVAKRDRKSASSMAVSPPPTTAIGLPRNSAPSQVAQADTPLFWSRFSESSPSQRAEAPVATMTESAVYRLLSVSTTKGRTDRSTRVASWKTIAVPKRSACFWNSSIINGPVIPLG